MRRGANARILLPNGKPIMDTLSKTPLSARERRTAYLVYRLIDMQSGLSFTGIALVFFGLILVANIPLFTLFAFLLALPCLVLGQSRKAVLGFAGFLSSLKGN